MNITLNHLKKYREESKKFSVLTCYDATFMRIINEAEIDAILVGDSLGMVVKGHSSTVPVTMRDMIYHTEAVARETSGNHQAFIMADLPFMAYHSKSQTLDNAAELMRAGANMVKLEGGAWQSDTVSRLADCGIPVCAHLGLTPQSVDKLGGYKVQGKTEQQKEKIFADAKKLEASGADIVLLECVPNSIAELLNEELSVPTIGIGAGPATDGQVLVLHDMLGLAPHPARFVKNFLTVDQCKSDNLILDAIKAYHRAVKDGAYPAPEHCYSS